MLPPWGRPGGVVEKRGLGWLRPVGEIAGQPEGEEAMRRPTEGAPSARGRRERPATAEQRDRPATSERLDRRERATRSGLPVELVGRGGGHFIWGPAIACLGRLFFWTPSSGRQPIRSRRWLGTGGDCCRASAAPLPRRPIGRFYSQSSPAIQGPSRNSRDLGLQPGRPALALALAPWPFVARAGPAWQRAGCGPSRACRPGLSTPFQLRLLGRLTYMAPPVLSPPRRVPSTWRRRLRTNNPRPSLISKFPSGVSLAW